MRGGNWRAAALVVALAALGEGTLHVFAGASAREKDAKQPLQEHSPAALVDVDAHPLLVFESKNFPTRKNRKRLLSNNPDLTSLTGSSDLLSKTPLPCSPCHPPGEPDFETNPTDCLVLLNESSLYVHGTPQCDAQQLLNFQKQCCRAPYQQQEQQQVYVPQALCSLCPNGDSYNGERNVPFVGMHATLKNRETASQDVSTQVEYTHLACAELSQQPSFYQGFMEDNGNCEDTMLRRSAAWCECPSSVQDQQQECHLCPDGTSYPSNRDNRKEVALYGWDCDSFRFFASLLKHGKECNSLHANSLLDFDAAAFCGCPGRQSSHQVVCNVCPNPDDDLQHNKLLADKGYTCGQLQESLRFVPTMDSCHRWWNELDRIPIQRECCLSNGGSAAAPSDNAEDYASIPRKSKTIWARLRIVFMIVAGFIAVLVIAILFSEIKRRWRRPGEDNSNKKKNMWKKKHSSLTSSQRTGRVGFKAGDRRHSRATTNNLHPEQDETELEEEEDLRYRTGVMG